MPKKQIKKPKTKREKLISLYPLKPEEALSAFIKVDTKKYKEWLKRQNGNNTSCITHANAKNKTQHCTKNKIEFFVYF